MLYKRQASTKDALKQWNKEVFGCCQDEINNLIQKIKQAQDLPPSQASELAEQALQFEPT